MQVFFEGRVEAAEIDNLGHMNVRVYARKAAQATFALGAAMGLTPARLAKERAVLQIEDAHTRFYREQLEGAALAVRGGVRLVQGDQVALYLEMINQATGDIAATFNNGFALFDGASRARRRLPGDVLDAAAGLRVDWPERGRPRSLPLDPVAPRDRQDVGAEGAFVRFPTYTVEAGECDAYRYMDLSDAKAIALARMPIKIERQHRAFRADHRVAIATLESRQTLFATPRLGDTVISETRHVAVTRKSVVFEHWSFEEATGTPFSLLQQFGLAFDLDARRATEFPDDMREALAANKRPEL
ncbi:MAG: hypothetical protein GC201_06760 [Alphaproteobacteria bacterium]|nr:hypothetical protein [Alphaproteobacteria bacterium]